MQTTNRLVMRKSLRGGASTLLLLLVAGAGTPAAAQQRPPSAQQPPATLDADEEADIEVERTAGWFFTPSAAAGVMWDSGIDTAQNVFVESVFQSWVGRFNPSGNLTFRGQRTQFGAGYSGSVERYWGANTNWEQHGGAAIRRAVSRRFSASADLSYSAAPTTDRLEVTEGLIPYVEVGSSLFNAGGGLQYQLSPRTSGELAYRFERVGIDRPVEFQGIGLLRDGHSHVPSVAVTHRFSERIGIGGRAEYRRENVGGLERAFNVQSGTLEFSYAATRRTTISGGGGASRLELVETGASTTAPTFHIGFGHQARQVSFDARFSRAFQPLFGFGTMASSNSFSAGAELPLDEERLYYLEAVISYDKTEPVEAIGAGFNFDSLWTNATIGRRLNQYVSAEAFVSIASQSAQAAIFPAAPTGTGSAYRSSCSGP